VLTREQMRRLYVLSDSELYTRAENFFKNEKDPNYAPQPLSNTQINGLLNIAQASRYELVLDFVKRQYTRDSQEEDVKTFYKALESVLKTLPRFAQEEGLLPEGAVSKEAKEERDLVHLLLAREFLQHLAAENMARRKLADEQREKQKREAREKREKQKWQAQQ
jgi:hypothetical protein